MQKKKSLFVTFEGIEGSGKSFQSRKLYKNIKAKKIPAILTREPGGTKGAEKIRRVILDDYFEQDSRIKFDKYTDTLLYLAARNEHLIDKIIPAIKRKKVVICDRFIDSTLAYQVHGKRVNKNLDYAALRRCKSSTSTYHNDQGGTAGDNSTKGPMPGLPDACQPATNNSTKGPMPRFLGRA